MRLTASVGRMGVNKKHDVALVQKIMKAIKVKTRMGTQPIRKGPADGRYMRDMEGEIACLQGMARLRETGKLEPTTQTMNAINRIVPPQYRNLSAMEGTTSVFATGKSNPNADRVARDIEMKAPFPKAERKALADAVRKVGKETGFCIRRGSDFITPEGNFATKMGFDMSSIPEAGTGQDATKAVAKVLAGTKGWTAISGTPMSFKTTMKLKGLKTGGVLNGKRLKAAGLKQTPHSQIGKSCVAGCLQIVECGAIVDKKGQVEFEAIIEALAADSPQIAMILAAYGKLQSCNIFKKKEKKIVLAVAKLANVDSGNATTIRLAVNEFWRLLESCGDPIARLALDINSGEGFGAGVAASRMRNFLGDKYIREINPPRLSDMLEINRPGPSGPEFSFVPNQNWRDKQKRWVETKFRDIQKDVAITHWEFASSDEKGIKGKLDAQQITKYHHEVFKKHGLPTIAFGGTPFKGNLSNPLNRLLLELGIWCAECDSFE